ncbi:MAG: hypothetical protein SGARI_002654, partial [Bacillariaceae sp.]
MSETKSEEKLGDNGKEDASPDTPKALHTEDKQEANITNNANTPSSKKKRKKKKKKRKSNNNKRGSNGGSNKHRKTEKFWIEDCSDSKVPPSASAAYQNTKDGNAAVAVAMSETTTATNTPPADVPFLELLISRSTLEDDYRHPPAPKALQEQTAESIGSKVTKEFEEKKDGSGEAKTITQDSVTVETILLNKNSAASEKESADEAVENKEGETAPAPSQQELSAPTPEYSTYHQSAQTSIDPDKAFICVKRANSAKQPMVWDHDHSIENFQPLPNGDCGDGIVNPYPKHVVPDKYWSQRRRLFSKYDQGIQLDAESWFSVTPEVIANHIAAHLVGNRRLDIDSDDDVHKKMIVLDPFGGCGGNSIAFARREEVELVISVDLDMEKLKMAASNAAIYGIPTNKLIFVHDNGCRVMSCFKNGRLTEQTPGNQSMMS